jgi:hypothetical protein
VIYEYDDCFNSEQGVISGAYYYYEGFFSYCEYITSMRCAVIFVVERLHPDLVITDNTRG